jgi:hypothetical protein
MRSGAILRRLPSADAAEGPSFQEIPPRVGTAELLSFSPGGTAFAAREIFEIAQLG